MKVKCKGCGEPYFVKNNASFICSLCGMLVDPEGETEIRKPWEEEGPERRKESDGESLSRSPFEFESCPGGQRVISCREELSDAEVPERWQGRPVVEIGDRAFRGWELQTLTLPESVKAIGEAAFENCHRLRRVAGGAQRMRIGERAFRNCVQLSAVELSGTPDAAISAFAGCYQLGVANENANYGREE